MWNEDSVKMSCSPKVRVVISDKRGSRSEGELEDYPQSAHGDDMIKDCGSIPKRIYIMSHVSSMTWWRDRIASSRSQLVL